MEKAKSSLKKPEEYAAVPQLVMRRGLDRDAEYILALYQSVKGTAFCTWDEDYPGREEIESDLLHQSLFLLEQEGRCIGALSVAPKKELAQQACWRVTENVEELARLAISPQEWGKGYAHVLMREVVMQLQKDGCQAIHLAVAAHHRPAQKVYFGLGFEKVGEADLFGHHFYLCEKVL